MIVKRTFELEVDTPTTIMALSLWEPWASLMAIQAKRVETRHWSTPYRGPIAIHAAKRFAPRERALCHEPAFYQPLAKAGIIKYPEPSKFAFGAIIAVANLAEVYRTDACIFNPVARPRDGAIILPVTERQFGDFDPWRYAWVFTHMVRLPRPISYSGRRGLWELERDVSAEIVRQASEVTHD